MLEHSTSGRKESRGVVPRRKIVSEHIQKQDIVITTALIPGHPAPILVTEDMVKSMKPGSVVVDLAVGAGGNCPISEQNKIVEKYGIKIIGYDNFPGRLPKNASSLFATNLLNFITPHINSETNVLNINWDDETITGTCITHEGKVIHPLLLGSSSEKKAAKEGHGKAKDKKLVSKEA